MNTLKSYEEPWQTGRWMSAVDVVLSLDTDRRSLLRESENLKAERNAVSKEISQTKDPAERQQKIDAMRLVGDEISQAG